MKEKTQTGIQLWALRSALENDFDKTLETLSKTGYNFVEPAGYDPRQRTFHGLKPKELKQRINASGLEMYSGHIKFNLADAEAVCTSAAEAGMHIIVCPSLSDDQRKNIDAYKTVAEEFNSIGEIAHKYGIQFGFHNHAQELEETEGLLPYDVLLKNTEANKVVFQMDLGWIVFAGYNPVDYFKKYPGRFPLWHIRDVDNHTGKSVSLGKGNIDLQAVFKERKSAGLKYGIVEMSSDNPDVMNSVIDSYHYLSTTKWY